MVRNVRRMTELGELVSLLYYSMCFQSFINRTTFVFVQFARVQASHSGFPSNRSRRERYSLTCFQTSYRMGRIKTMRHEVTIARQAWSEGPGHLVYSLPS
ncbi:hypothetical protein K503DRAFT_465487 [Rhizopogon vinicolor AM-OR11-026]|uniref:Uncharacterized protein n=1 Tax=Rhizopogon vinicolor AM-OR11-026 TaxID=1314800 RepID=A0A1B7MNJ8_9AGAM|nr:hypothetical protein K503DRAFT_465487 [Rhizopogon vinicolor AM-OR11-026]